MALTRSHPPAPKIPAPARAALFGTLGSPGIVSRVDAARDHLAKLSSLRGRVISGAVRRAWSRGASSPNRSREDPFVEDRRDPHRRDLNIREFGRRPRLKAWLHYIAEIIGRFDLVSVVELRDNIEDLAQVLGYLGPSWDVVFSDYISDAGGNHERIGFVFDRRAVTFTGLASNAEAPRKKVGDEYLPTIDWWRPPFMASFRSGAVDFVLLAAHIRWAGTDDGVRLPEIEMLADWVKKRTHEAFIGNKDWLVVGDFNIPNTESAFLDRGPVRETGGSHRSASMGV